MEITNTSTLDTIAIGANGATFNGGSIFLFQPGTTTDFVAPAGTTVYPLFTNAGSITGSANNLTIANPQGGKFYSFSGTSTINLTIGDATTTNWNGSSDGSWANGGNWVGGSVPNAVGTSVRFDGSVLSGSANTTITLNGAKTASGILFDDLPAGSTTSFTIQGADTLTLNNGVAAAGITVTNGQQTISAPVNATNSTAVSLGNSNAGLTISGAFTGGKPLTISGSGTLTLTANNTYTTTGLSSETLNVRAFGGASTAGTLGSSDITISNGATLNFNRSNPYNFAGGISGTGASGTVNQLGSGTTTVTGPITNVVAVNVSAGSLIASSTISQTGGINVTGSGSLTANGSISGTGGLTVDTSGAVSLNANNNYGGTTTLNNGTLTLNSATAHADQRDPGREWRHFRFARKQYFLDQHDRHAGRRHHHEQWTC